LQSLDVIVPTSVYDPNNFVSTFNKRIALTGDTSFGYKRLCVNTAAHYFNYARDHAVSSPLSALTSGSNGFQHKNYAMSGYIEILGLLVGEKYDIDPSVGVVNKVIYAPNEGALEIALRVGAERYHNFAAANFVKNAFSSVPYTYTKNIGYNAVALTASIDDSFAVGYSGYTIHATYYMNKNILFKTEFYDNKTHLRTASNWTTLETEQGLRLRSEFNF
jgi:hypothetical protein